MSLTDQLNNQQIEYAETTERGEILFAQLTQIQAEVQKIQEVRTSQLRAILDTKQKIESLLAKRQKKV